MFLNFFTPIGGGWFKFLGSMAIFLHQLGEEAQATRCRYFQIVYVIRLIDGNCCNFNLSRRVGISSSIFLVGDPNAHILLLLNRFTSSRLPQSCISFFLINFAFFRFTLLKLIWDFLLLMPWIYVFRWGAGDGFPLWFGRSTSIQLNIQEETRVWISLSMLQWKVITLLDMFIFRIDL